MFFPYFGMATIFIFLALGETPELNYLSKKIKNMPAYAESYTNRR